MRMNSREQNVTVDLRQQQVRSITTTQVIQQLVETS